MKKHLVSLLCLAAVAAAHADSVTLSFGLGTLTDQAGDPLADGSLLQVIGSHDGTFGAPTAGDYLGGDASDYLITSIGLDSSIGGGPGAMSIFLGDLPLVAGGLTAGDELIVRWFPSLGVGDPAAAGAAYGQYGYAQDSSWVVPSGGGFGEYSLITSDFGGNQSADDAKASLTVSPSASVPDLPSSATTWLGAAAIAGLLALRSRRRSLA